VVKFKPVQKEGPSRVLYQAFFIIMCQRAQLINWGFVGGWLLTNKLPPKTQSLDLTYLMPLLKFFVGGGSKVKVCVTFNGGGNKL